MELINSACIFYTIFIILLHQLEAKFSCEFKENNSHVEKLFFGTTHNVSIEDCGLVQNENDLVDGFPWDVTVYFEDEHCVAPGVIISQMAILFDIGTCIHPNKLNDRSKPIMTFFLAGITSNYAEAPKIHLETRNIFTVPSTNDQMAIATFQNVISVNNSSITPVCLYNNEEWDGENFHTFLHTEDDIVANVKFSLRLKKDCAQRVKTPTQCTQFNSCQLLCVEPTDRTDVFSSTEFLYLKKDYRYYLRGKFLEIYPEAYAISTVLDLGPITPLLVPVVPDLYALEQEPASKPAKHKFKYPDNLSYPECGRLRPPTSSAHTSDSSNAQVSNLIVNGTIVPREKLHFHPWHALFEAKYYTVNFDVETKTCGGTLISDTIIITAAHCLYTTDESVTLLDPGETTVSVGVHAISNEAEETRQKSEVKTFIVHEEYEGTHYNHDIALIVIKSPFRITLYVRPACLWNSYPSIEDIVGINGQVVGWGLDHNYKKSEKLREADITIISHEECFSVDRRFYSQRLTYKKFCAGRLNSVSVCNGDSGGGLVIFRDSNRRFFLRGIVSIAKSKTVYGEQVCDTSAYALFTDIVPYIPWILNKAEIN